MKTGSEENISKAVQEYVQKKIQQEAGAQNISDGSVRNMTYNFSQILEKTIFNFKSKPFWWLNWNQIKILIETDTRSLWHEEIEYLYFSDTDKYLRTRQVYVPGWIVPEKNRFLAFAHNETNPLRLGINNRLNNKNKWITTFGVVDLDISKQYFRTTIKGRASLCSLNQQFEKKDTAELILHALENNCTLTDTHGGQRTDILKDLKTFSFQETRNKEQSVESTTSPKSINTLKDKLEPLTSLLRDQNKQNNKEPSKSTASPKNIEAPQKQKEDKDVSPSLFTDEEWLAVRDILERLGARSLLDIKDSWEKPFLDFLRTIDSRSCPLPELEDAQFSDIHKGMWEFWPIQQSCPDVLKKLKIRARNPVEDLRSHKIAIDFGTSSTVVAYEENGQKKLLRIGVKNFWESEKPHHYENPTVLEFVDFPAMLNAWQKQSYRPAISWDDVRCSHEAMATLRDNEGNANVSASILCKIKQWALRVGEGTRVFITDTQNSCEHELAPLTLRNPVKGTPLQVSSEDPFDPAELYAWFLGMCINWRQRGLFTDYYMTFPVTYPKDVKEKILASFRRGLQRSLPESFVDQESFDSFTVEERASEPAAFAAAALPYWKIEPTEKGIPYGIFDFGGGTTDFDFGLYRLATEEEENLGGYEEVFEHFGASGDVFLGGENLLENLAYLVFHHNEKVCREKQIAFTKPLDAKDFPGSEMLLEKTQAASTNTQMLMARLRSFWEKGEQNSSGIEKIQLLNRAGTGIACELKMPYPQMETYVVNRIKDGVDNFFTELHKAFSEKGNMPESVHIFLGGNASLSSRLHGILGLKNGKPADFEFMSEIDQAVVQDVKDQVKTALSVSDIKRLSEPDKIISEARQGILSKLEKLFSGSPPKLRIYPPIPQNSDNPYQPTAKTGVALGLLDLCPGSSTLIVSHAVQEEEAPFNHYVGRFVRKKFKPLLSRHANYREWQELGPIRESTFELVHTQSAQAITGEVPKGDSTLSVINLKLAGVRDGHKLFAMATAPSQIKICTAENLEQVKNNPKDNFKTIDLH